MTTSRTTDTSAALGRIAVFAALIVVLGTVIVPLPSGVPITAQTLGVMLAGLVLGPRLAPLAVVLVSVPVPSVMRSLCQLRVRGACRHRTSIAHCSNPALR